MIQHHSNYSTDYSVVLHRKYKTLYGRLSKAIASRRFYQYTRKKQAALYQQLQRYERRLQHWGIAVASATALFLLPQAVSAQTALPNGSEFKVNTYTTSNQRNSSVAIDSDGDFVITWQSLGQDGGYYGIYGQRYNSSGVAQGSEFKVNTYTPADQRNSAVAMDSDGDFVVTWTSYGQDGSSTGIYGQRYNSSGAVQGSEFQVNTYTTSSQRFGSVAMDSDGDFVVIWASYRDGNFSGTYGQRYNSGGIPQGSEFQVNTYTTGFQVGASVAMDSDGDFVVIWGSFSGQDGSEFGIYGRRYNSSGVAQGGEFQVNTYITNSQTNPSVAMDSDGDFVVTWASDGQDGDGYGIYGQRYNSSGVAQGGEFKVNNYTTALQSDPSVAMDSDGDFVVMWTSYGQDGSNLSIYGQRYNSSGVAQGGEFQVNTYITNSQRNPLVTMDSDGDFVVTWYSRDQDGSYYGIYAQRYNDPRSEFKVNTYTTSIQNRPSVAMDSDGDFVVTWQSERQDGSSYNIYGQRYNNSGVAQGSEFQVNTYTTSIQNNSSVAIDSDGDFVVTWASYSGQDGSYEGIYGQRYNSLGVAQGSEFKVNTYTTDRQRNPSVAMDSDGDFVVTWRSNGQDGSSFGIYGQRYNSSGMAQGSEFKVNSYNTNRQNFPSVAMDSDGDFVVTWQSSYFSGVGQDGDSYGIYGQRYNSSGMAQGSEFKINTHTTNIQSDPSVAMDSDGDFVVTWMSRDQDGDSYGVYAQRYNSSGVAQGIEFKVNTYTTSNQGFPSVSMDSDGDFVVTWISSGQDGSDFGIYGQRYNSLGLAVGSEFQINTYTTSRQSSPSMAIDSDGNFVVTWTSSGQDGNLDGIYGQRYIINTASCPVLLTNPLPIGITNETCAITIQANSQTAQEYDISSDVSITLLPNTHLVAGSDVHLFINPSPMPLTSDAPTAVASALEARTSEILVTDQSYPIIYPNPTSQTIEIGLKTWEEIESVEIFDHLGKMVRTFYHPTPTIALDDLSNGWYILRININGSTYVRRVLKQ